MITLPYLIRSLVPKCDIQPLNGLPPKPNTKTKHWNQAMFELKKYGENIDKQGGREKLAGVKDKTLKQLIMREKTAAGQNSTLKSNKEQSGSDQYSISNHNTSQPPPVVEVTPSSDRGGGGDGSAMSDADVSSPGTPPSLQIDLEGPAPAISSIPQREKSPSSKGRAMPSGGRSLIGAINRNSQVPGSLDFNSESGPQVVGSPTVGGSKVKRKPMMKAGAALSALVSSLTQRKRVAEMGVQSGLLTPVHQGAAVAGGGAGGGVPMQEDVAEQAPGKAKSGEEAQDKTDSPFSSIYENQHKTAIALVDPNQKRKRSKVAKVGDTPPSKKARPDNNNSSTKATAAGAGKGEGDASMSDPAAYVAKIQEYGNVAINALSTSAANTSSSPSISAAITTPSKGSSLSASPQHATPTNSTTTTTGGGGGAQSSLSKSKSATGGKKRTAKKGADKSRGKSPLKGAKNNATSSANNSAAAAAVSASKSSSSLAGSSLAALITATTTTTSASSHTAAFVNQVSQGAASSNSSPGSGGGAAAAATAATSSGGGGANSNNSSSGGEVRGGSEVRGEAAAPGMCSEEVSDFAEGTGLLADTIRKVNTSFMARVSQMTGSTDDMGYKYFEEKVRNYLFGITDGTHLS